MQECLQRQNHSLLGAASETITGWPEFISRPPLVWRFSSWLTKGALNPDALPFYGLLFRAKILRTFRGEDILLWQDAGRGRQFWLMHISYQAVDLPVTWRDFRAQSSNRKRFTE